MQSQSIIKFEDCLKLLCKQMCSGFDMDITQHERNSIVECDLVFLSSQNSSQKNFSLPKKGNHMMPFFDSTRQNLFAGSRKDLFSPKAKQQGFGIYVLKRHS